MINPGMIELLSQRDMLDMGFDSLLSVSDCLGESIHIYYRDIRIELTVKEFEKLIDSVEVVVNELIACEGFDCRHYDPLHLLLSSKVLPFLRSIQYRDIALESIIVPTIDSEGKHILGYLPESVFYKAICGDEQQEANEKCCNYFSSPFQRSTNAERRKYGEQLLEKGGYPGNIGLITVLNYNLISDGQHRASYLYSRYGNIEVPAEVWDIASITQNPLEEQRRIYERKQATEQELEQLKVFCASCSHIYLYGAGKYGGRYFFLLNYFGVPVDGFIATEKHKDTYFGRPVYAASEFRKFAPENSGVIRAVHALSAEEMQKNLAASEVKFLDPDEDALNWFAAEYFHDKKP